MLKYLQTLNDKQLEAVQHTEGFLRVIAGAGSGKTKLLVSRYAYLVKEYGINSLKEIPTSLLLEEDSNEETLLIEDKSDELDGVFTND